MRLNSLTDKGDMRRDNQDNFWSARLEVDGREVGVVCICDGMGGLNNGRLASSKVVSTIREYVSSSLDIHGMVDRIKSVNKELCEIGKEHQLGTTCTVVICDSGVYHILHIGDSRCYHISGDEVKQLTVDHSALQKYGITKEKDEYLYNKYKSSLTRCIGVEDEIIIDYFTGRYCSGDAFLVCSDGFWHNGNILKAVREGNLSQYIGDCRLQGETDNITVSILEV